MSLTAYWFAFAGTVCLRPLGSFMQLFLGATRPDAALDAVFDAAARSVARPLPCHLPCAVATVPLLVLFPTRCQSHRQSHCQSVGTLSAHHHSHSPVAFTSRTRQSHSPVACSSRASLLSAALCLSSLLSFLLSPLPSYTRVSVSSLSLVPVPAAISVISSALACTE